MYPPVVLDRMNLFGRMEVLVRWPGNYQRARSSHISFVARLTGAKPRALRGYLRDLYDDNAFFDELDRRFQRHLGTKLQRNFFERGVSQLFQSITLYVLIRALKPEVIIETGGAAGNSTAFSLLALEHNHRGRLITLDLPPGEAGQIAELKWWTEEMEPCFLVPEELKGRWELRLGDAKETLPPALHDVGPIDLFLHDSDHSYEHMTFELEAAWEGLRPRGVLVSDDVSDNEAWHDFCSHLHLRPVASTLKFAGVVKL